MFVSSGEGVARAVGGEQGGVNVTAKKEVIWGRGGIAGLLFGLDKVEEKTTEGRPSTRLGGQVHPNDAEEARACGAVPNVHNAQASSKERVGNLRLRGEGRPTPLDNDANSAAMHTLRGKGSPVAKEGGGVAGLWAALKTVAYALFAGESPIKKRLSENEDVWCLTRAGTGILRRAGR